MYQNPKDVVLPESSDMDALRRGTLTYLDLGYLLSNVSRYSLAISQATTPLEIAYYLKRQSRLLWVDQFFSHMSRDDLSETFIYSWTDAENPNMDPNVTRAESVRLFQLCNTEKLMSKKEYESFISLPDELTVYRGLGGINIKNIKALSWTLDINKAKWFAKRFECLDPNIAVYKAKISRKHVFAYINDRNEEEIILDYHKLKDIESIPL